MDQEWRHRQWPTIHCRPGTTAPTSRRSSTSWPPSRRRAATSSCRKATASPPSTTTAPSGPSSRSTRRRFFALDQIKTLAPQHPEWQTEQPFAAILAGDQEAMKQFSEEDIGKIVAAAHSGMTTDQFDEQARPGPRRPSTRVYDRLFTESIYQPQLELLDYLRGQRLSDLHRLRRRHRPDAHLRRGDLRHSTQPGRRQQREGERTPWRTACRP